MAWVSKYSLGITPSNLKRKAIKTAAEIKIMSAKRKNKNLVDGVFLILKLFIILYKNLLRI